MSQPMMLKGIFDQGKLMKVALIEVMLIIVMKNAITDIIYQN